MVGNTTAACGDTPLNTVAEKEKDISYDVIEIVGQVDNVEEATGGQGDVQRDRPDVGPKIPNRTDPSPGKLIIVN